MRSAPHSSSMDTLQAFPSSDALPFPPPSAAPRKIPNFSSISWVGSSSLLSGYVPGNVSLKNIFQIQTAFVDPTCQPGMLIFDNPQVSFGDSCLGTGSQETSLTVMMQEFMPDINRAVLHPAMSFPLSISPTQVGKTISIEPSNRRYLFVPRFESRGSYLTWDGNVDILVPASMKPNGMSGNGCAIETTVTFSATFYPL